MQDQPITPIGSHHSPEVQAAQAAEARLQLENKFKSGASWFFWIAGLSIVNSTITLFQGQWSFLIGLGITQVIDAIMKEMGGAAPMIGFVIGVVIAGVFALFGFFASQRRSWAFYVGMTLYALDGLLFLLAQDWLSIGFHVFALYCVYGGLAAHKQLSELEAMQPAAARP
jgi:hypothetical protein